MKRFFLMNGLLLLVTAMTGLCGCSDDAEGEFPDLVPGLGPVEDNDRPAQNFKVMSFNIRVNSVDPNPSQGLPTEWETRKSLAVEVIRDEQPTIVGIQEAYYKAQWLYLKEQLADYGYEAIGLPIGVWENLESIVDRQANTQVVGILYRPEEVTLEDWGVFSLSETPDMPCTTPALGASYTRGATWAIFRLNESQRRIFFVNTHLDTAASPVPELEWKVIVEQMSRHNTDNLYDFVTGDFNEGRTSNLCKTMYETFNEAALMGDWPDRSVNTFNNYQDALTTSYIDHILYSKSNNRIRIFDYRVVRKKDGNVFVSDHWPIWAEFSY